MTEFIKRAAVVGALAALPLGLGAGELAAQEEAPAGQEVCTAQLTPATVPAGETPVKVKVELSQGIGALTGLEAGESGLALARIDAEAEQEMAAEGEAEAETLELAENEHLVRFDATNAQPGEFTIIFEGEAGECSASVTVEGEESEYEMPVEEPVEEAGEEGSGA